MRKPRLRQQRKVQRLQKKEKQPEQRCRSLELQRRGLLTDLWNPQMPRPEQAAEMLLPKPWKPVLRQSRLLTKADGKSLKRSLAR